MERRERGWDRRKAGREADGERKFQPDLSLTNYWQVSNPSFSHKTYLIFSKQ